MPKKVSKLTGPENPFKLGELFDIRHLLIGYHHENAVLRVKILPGHAEHIFPSNAMDESGISLRIIQSQTIILHLEEKIHQFSLGIHPHGETTGQVFPGPLDLLFRNRLLLDPLYLFPGKEDSLPGGDVFGLKTDLEGTGKFPRFKKAVNRRRQLSLICGFPP